MVQLTNYFSYGNIFRSSGDDMILGTKREYVCQALSRIHDDDLKTKWSTGLRLTHIFNTETIPLFLDKSFNHNEGVIGIHITDVKSMEDMGRWLYKKIFGKFIEINDDTVASSELLNTNRFNEMFENGGHPGGPNTYIIPGPIGYKIAMDIKLSTPKNLLVDTIIPNSAYEYNAPIHSLFINQTIYDIFHMYNIGEAKHFAGKEPAMRDMTHESKSTSMFVKYFFMVGGFFNTNREVPTTPGAFVDMVEVGIRGFLSDVLLPAANDHVNMCIEGKKDRLDLRNCSISNVEHKMYFASQSVFELFAIPIMAWCKSQGSKFFDNEDSAYDIIMSQYTKVANFYIEETMAKWIDNKHSVGGRDVSGASFTQTAKSLTMISYNWDRILKSYMTFSHESIIVFSSKRGCVQRGALLDFNNVVGEAKIPVFEDFDGLDYLGESVNELTMSELESANAVTSEQAVNILNKKAPTVSPFAKCKIVSDARVDKKMVSLIGKLRQRWVGKSDTAETVSLTDSQKSTTRELEKVIAEVFNFKDVHINLAGEQANASTATFTLFIEDDWFTPEEIKAGVIEVTSKGVKFKKKKVVAYINLDRGLLVNSLIKDRMINAVLIHEIGHQFDEYNKYDDYMDHKKRQAVVANVAGIHSTITLLPAFFIYVMPEIKYGDLPLALIMLNSIVMGYVQNLGAVYYSNGGAKLKRKDLEDSMKKIRTTYEKGAKIIVGNEDSPLFKYYMDIIRGFETVIDLYFTIEGGIHLIRDLKMFILNDTVAKYLHPTTAYDFWSNRIHGKQNHKKEYNADSMAVAYGYATDLHMALVILGGQRYDEHTPLRRLLRNTPVLNLMMASYKGVTGQLDTFIQGGSSHPAAKARINASIQELEKIMADDSTDATMKKKLKRDIAELNRTKEIMKHTNVYAAILNTDAPKEAKIIRTHYAEEAMPADIMYVVKLQNAKEPEAIAKDLLKITKKMHKLRKTGGSEPTGGLRSVGPFFETKGFKAYVENMKELGSPIDVAKLKKHFT